jgi:hypothetical protein
VRLIMPMAVRHGRKDERWQWTVIGQTALRVTGC